MKITSRWKGAIAILHIEGVLTAYGGQEPLYRRVRRLTQGKGVDVVLDLSGVDRMDAAGVGELVLLRLRLEAIEGSLKLVGVNERLRKLLDLVGLLGVFEPADSMRDAVASLKAQIRARDRAETAEWDPDWSDWRPPTAVLAQEQA